MFASLTQPAPDPILGIAERFAADPSASKVDLGIGIYKDKFGKAPVLYCVKRAEAWLLEQQDSKAYLSSAGNELYNACTIALLLDGADSPVDKTRARTIQTPGGTGALRLAADFLTLTAGARQVWISDPTWANHRGIFAAAGHKINTYPYYDGRNGTVAFEALIAALATAASGDVVVLHGSCHNPTGADLSRHQWAALGAVIRERGLLPLVDLAYQGFADGVEEDAFAVRALANLLPELIIASSYSKNFALYRERTGALTFIGENAAAAGKAHGHALTAARVNYSMPPDHGAAVVAQVLSTPDLRDLWIDEVREMRERIHEVRRAFAVALTSASGRDFGFIAGHKGMFTQFAVQPESVAALRDIGHVHISGSGRINVAGLTLETVQQVAAAVAEVMKKEAK